MMHQLYQTMKRINRDNDLISEYFLVMKDNRITKNIKKLFEGINCDVKFDLPLEEIQKEVINKREAKARKARELMAIIVNNPGRPESLKINFCKIMGIEPEYLKREIFRHHSDLYMIPLQKPHRITKIIS